MQRSIWLMTFSIVSRSLLQVKFILWMPWTELALDETLSRLRPRRVKMMEMRLSRPTWFSVNTDMVNSCFFSILL